MSKYRRFAIVFIFIELLLLVCANIYMQGLFAKTQEKYYKVDISRIVARMEQGEKIESIDLKDYEYIISVRKFDPKVIYKGEYALREIEGILYSFEYIDDHNGQIEIMVNAIMGLCIVANIILLIYLDRKMIRPFFKMNYLTTELAKGNLSVPIQQEKSKFFGKFLWGMDMLRETLEGDKQRELKLLKEKKTLILSLSHDIKTPLSAIDLYNKALKKGMYTSDEDKNAAFEGIEKNIEEIKRYVKEITKASREDFLTLNVNISDCYLSQILSAIREYYEEKMKRLHIEFSVMNTEDCMIHGDFDRIVEVLQNVIENAIKYGDGKKITINLDEEENCKLLTVCNGGCSLAEEELPHIFDSFYRGSNSEKQEGSGLGLYICKELMHKMDGDLFAKIKDREFYMTVVLRKE